MVLIGGGFWVRVVTGLVAAGLASSAACGQAAVQASTQTAQAGVAPSTDEARAKAVEARRLKVQEDVDRLVLMAVSLKASVDILKKDELSVEVVREADRIERLAKTVKESSRQ